MKPPASLSRYPSVAIAALLLALPWLNPFAPGPTPNVVPLLFCWGCAAILLATQTLVPLRDEGEMARAMATAWLVAGVCSALFALLQYFGAAGDLAPWINRTGPGEAFANLRQRNQFATLTNMALAALLWFLARTGRLPQWALPVAICLAAGNAASASRTGLVQLLLLAALAVVWKTQRTRAIVLVLLVAVLGYALASVALPLLLGLDLSTSGMLARLRTGAPPCASRITLWSNVVHLIAQHPWIGWGWGELDYAHFITLYPGARFCDILDNAHNLPLHLAVELGIPLAILCCALAFWWIWRARPWRDTEPSRQLAWSVLALIMLHSLLEYPLWYGPFQIAALVSCALLWLTRGPAGRSTGAPLAPVSGRRVGATAPAAGPAAGPAARAAVLGVSAALLAFIFYAGWDYWRISQIYLAPELRALAYRRHTLAKISDSRLFSRQVRFARLTTTEVSFANALQVHALAEEMLHFSPEARVVQKLIESATLLGRGQEALFFEARFRAAFPDEFAKWRDSRLLRNKEPSSFP